MNTKLHAIADANGRPLSFFMTAGQVSDYTGAAALLDDMPKAQWLLGPGQHGAGPHHRAGNVTALRRRAPRSCSASPSVPFRPAHHRGPIHEHMALARYAPSGADHLDERVSRLDRCCLRARLVGTAGAIGLASGDSSDAQGGPSAHQTGPSPSQTRVGVHWKLSPAGTICTAASRSGRIMPRAAAG